VNAIRAGALAGARILVTRPAHQADGLCHAIAAAGGTALRLPLFAIMPAADDSELRQRLDAARGAAWWLFTSANAATAAITLLPPPWLPRVAAVGPATAAVLGAAGIQDIIVPPAEFSGAGLAALPEFADAAGRDCAIVTGEDGRTDLADALRARGGRVARVALYRRDVVTHAATAVVALIESCDAIVVTSLQSLERMYALTPAERRPALLQKPLLVPSPRVVEHARTMGFLTPPLLPDRVADAAFIDALAEWWCERR